MARKKPAEEHENLERYLVSYADFMTLLFATFVVLYALAQSDVNSFKGIEEALRKAFTQNIFDDEKNIMEGTNSIFEGEQGATNPLMLEYVSPKYEQTSFDEIEKEIDDLDTDGLSSGIDERGLVITLNSNAVNFAPGTAELTPQSLEILNQVAKIIKDKFSIHYIRVEGHSDSDPTTNKTYPTNWELSSARACSVVRFLINNYGFNPKIFSAIGLADTEPVAANNSPANKAKNRRVEIIVLKNQHKALIKKDTQQIMDEVQKQRTIERKKPSEAVEGLVGNDKELLKNVIDMSDQYESEAKRLKSIENSQFINDGQKPDILNSTER